LRGAEFAIGGGPARASFEGFECAWRPLPSEHGEIVCLLVVALGDGDAEKESTYREVASRLDAILDGPATVPVSRASLELQSVSGDYSIEARVRSQQRSGLAFTRAQTFARTRTAVALGLMTLGVDAFGFDGKRYKDEFINNTDFRKFDETLRMVLDLRPDQSAALEAWLLERSGRGQLAFGLHRSTAALATCMVKAYHGDHVHFVDGADGGYALAARGLKEQLEKLR
jgi:hypothetical protein